MTNEMQSFTESLYGDSYLEHYGIKGMKWGVRRTPEQLGHRSTSPRAAIARRQNKKVDEGFKNWKEGAQNRDNAITLGKERNAARMAYELDKTNKEAKAQWKQSEKAYKKALKENTTYRKGTVRQDVGKDLSRKYLTEAKRIKKQLDADPSNKQLQKQYNKLMSQHDIERARARKAQDVGAKRSRRIATMKANATKTAKGVAATAAVGVGLAAANRYLGGRKIPLNSAQVLEYIKKAKRFMEYIY